MRRCGGAFRLEMHTLVLLLAAHQQIMDWLLVKKNAHHIFHTKVTTKPVTYGSETMRNGGGGPRWGAGRWNRRRGNNTSTAYSTKSHCCSCHEYRASADTICCSDSFGP